MNGFTPTIGLEIHAELQTNTKMFCNSPNNPEEKRPNVNICPVCMGHPGTLPTINKEAVRKVLLVGKSLGGTLADFTEFDRKNYFYPDIPKGYQISQYKHPLVSGGALNGVRVTRIHLEEDTARSSHDAANKWSLLDFNRAGVPLMELVTDPVIKTAKQAGDFARELKLVLRYLGASEASMEKGQMRVEANVSVSQDEKLSTKVEVKNINSFRAVERAIEYEVRRQTLVIEAGERVAQETRGWDDVKQETFSQRSKESAHDYRYFPDPDLPKLYISEIPEFAELTLPELPQAKRERYRKDYGIKDEDIESFITDPALAAFFENVAVELKRDADKVRLASNYITSDLIGLIAKSGKPLAIPPKDFADLIAMVSAGALSSRGVKNVLAVMFREGGAPKMVAEREGLLQKSDTGELKAIVLGIIAEHKAVAEEYRAGKAQALQYLVGQAMKATKGSGNPAALKKLFEEALASQKL